MGYKPVHQVGNAGGEFEKRREELAGHAKAGAALGESTLPLSREHKRRPSPPGEREEVKDGPSRNEHCGRLRRK